MLLAVAAVLTAMVVAAEPTGTGAGSHGAVAGTVTLTDASGQAFDAPGVRLTLKCDATPDATRAAVSDDRGTFRFRDVLPDRCSIDADLEGFANKTALAVVRAGETADVAMHLDIAPMGTGLRVLGESARPRRTNGSTDLGRRASIASAHGRDHER
jgi:Carboxypeptidase regulatory-like domain